MEEAIARLQMQKNAVKAENVATKPALSLDEWCAKGRQWAIEKGSYKTLLEWSEAVGRIDELEAQLVELKADTSRQDPRSRCLWEREHEKALQELRSRLSGEVHRLNQTKTFLGPDKPSLAFVRGAVKSFREAEQQMTK